MALIPKEGQTLREWFTGLDPDEQDSWLSTQSLKVKFSLLPVEQQRAWIAEQPIAILDEIARGDWWWEARPSQIPPKGAWSIHLVLSGRGYGKAVTINTSIPTVSGFRPIGELCVGDQVFDEHGKPCNVTAVFDSMPDTAYRMTFSDGVTVDACGDHQWITWTHAERKKYLRDMCRTEFPADWAATPPRTTQNIADTFTYGKRGDRNHCIPLAGALDLPEADLPIDPWILGYWLGNGSSAAGSICTHADDAEWVARRCREAGYRIELVKQPDRNSTVGTPYGLVGQLRSLGLLGNKHVPQAYLWTSADLRRRLLAGLLDSDGYMESSKVEFCSMTQGLAESVLHLVRSLGGKAVLTKGRAMLNGVDHGVKYRVSWRAVTNPFLSPRKSAQFVMPGSQALRNRHRMITDITPIEPTPMRCITVDSPNSMYLCTEALIPTHNSRAGSEWIVQRCLDHPADSSGFPTEHLVIAETLADARIICAEGPSGILRVLERQDVEYRYIRSPKPKIVLTKTDTRIFFEGADDPDVGRGYNAASLWADESAKWPDAKASWEQGIMPSLRANIIGDHPRAFITTTPKPSDLLREWLGRTDGTVSVVRGSTYENLVNLSTVVLRELHRRYAGTALGRQELEGELVENSNGILFSGVDIERARIKTAPHRDLLTHVVVGVDPGLTGHEDGDETGVIVVGKDKDDQFYVLADATVQRVGRDAAVHAWTMFAKYDADVLVYESNLGKAWMELVFKDAFKELQNGGMFEQDTTAPLKAVFSTQGKKLRAEPVAMRYEQGRVSHVGRFDLLEQQMLTFDPLKPGSKHHSPDRLDALVHALRHLMKIEKSKAQIIVPTGKVLDLGGRGGSTDLYF